MPSFGAASLAKLATCHPDLQRLAQAVVATMDCTITCGFRDEAAQHAAFLSGASQKDWPDGNHNKNPSTAMDIYPFPIPVKGEKRYSERFYFFAGYVLATARSLGIPIRWGGDWNSNNDLNDQGFFDLVHYEMVSP